MVAEPGFAVMAEYMQRGWRTASGAFGRGAESACSLARHHQRGATEGSELLAAFAREFVVKVEDELQKVCGGIVVFMDKSLRICHR